jgi:hypothetical protein
MTSNRSIARAGALLVPIALILGSCSSSGASGSPSASSGTGAASASAPAPPAASTGTGGSSAASGAGGAIPSFDIGVLTQGLSNLDSYQATITVGGTEVYKGIVVNKPTPSRDVTISGTRIVTIGDQAWLAQPGGKLTLVPETMAAGLFATYDPTLMVSAFAGLAWAANSADMGVEQKNGVSAHHYHIDSTTIQGGFTALPAGAVIDVWIAQDQGYLVAFEATGTSGGDISIQVTNVNDPNNKVETPS